MSPTALRRRSPDQGCHGAAPRREDDTTREADSPAPVLVSDKTATTILSLPSSTTFIPFLAALGVKPFKIGRRWYARLDAILTAFDDRSGAARRTEWSEADMLERAIGARK
jgi:hypothetical protein